jgi:peptidoglycan/LPS O-acetylase OafA/YrhL
MSHIDDRLAANAGEERPSGDRLNTVRIRSLDGLRGVACGVVVFHHACTTVIQSLLGRVDPRIAEASAYLTASGVECFFALSACVLLRPYLPTRRPVLLLAYTGRRISRIYPPFLAAWALAAIVRLVVLAVPTWYTAGVDSWSTTNAITQTNLFVLGCPSIRLLNAAWWSLAVEAAWYLIVPVIIFANVKFGILDTPAKAMVAIGLSTACSIATAWRINENGACLVHLIATLGTYASCFAFGVGFGVFTPRLAWCAASVAGAALLYAVLIITDQLRFAHLALGLAWGGVIGLAIKLPSFSGALSSPPMVWFGERSYSLFLVHFTAFELANWLVSMWTPARTIVYGVVSRVIGIPLAWLFAIMIFWTVERHFAHGLSQVASRTVCRKPTAPS